MRDDDELLTASLGVLHEDRFGRAIERASLENGRFLASLTRAVALEKWLRTSGRQIFDLPPGQVGRRRSYSHGKISSQLAS